MALDVVLEVAVLNFPVEYPIWKLIAQGPDTRASRDPRVAGNQSVKADRVPLVDALGAVPEPVVRQRDRRGVPAGGETTNQYFVPA